MPRTMPRPRGLSARLKLTLSYVGFLIVAGVLLLAAVGLFLLRYVPDGNIRSDQFVPNQSDLLRVFTPVATAVSLFLLVFGVVGGWVLAGRMLRPLSRIGEVAQRVAEGSLSHRVALDGPGDEFRDLADIFDSMLDRLEAQIAESQRFAANASHELRTPLAISQTLLEVASRDPDRDVNALISRLQAVNTRAIELTEALLLLSRADRLSAERDTVDLSLVAEEAVETLVPLADRRSVTLDVAGDPVLIAGSAALVQQLIANLVHNAIVHNLPRQGTVSVHTSSQADCAIVTIENTGETIAPERVSMLIEPFQRGAERVRSADHAGVGLGLAIAERIAHAHDGSLQLAPREGGGLVVTVRLPHPSAAVRRRAV